MARPKSTAPRKKALNITVSEELRNKLDFISKQEGKSISVLVEEWAEKEFKKVSKKAKTSYIPISQISLFDDEEGGIKCEST